MGFWIRMTADATLDVTGSIPETTDISLSTAAGGWNMVGYPSIDSGVLPGIQTVNTTRIFAYHASDGSDPWKIFDVVAPPYANDLVSMMPGWGYWVYVTADETWTITY